LRIAHFVIAHFIHAEIQIDVENGYKLQLKTVYGIAQAVIGYTK
jgi:hypothetical protein